jgi:hypothetical protein
VDAVRGEVSLGIESARAAGTSSGDGLSIIVVGNVAGREDSFDAREGARGLGQFDVAFCIQFELASEKVRVRGVADREENARRLDLAVGLADGARKSNRGDAMSIGSLDFFDSAVPNDLHLRVFERALLHDLAGAEFVSAMNEIDLAGELGEVACFFDGRVAATNHHERLLSKARQSTIANGTGADPSVQKRMLAGQAEVVRAGARGNDDGVSLDRFSLVTFDLEGWALLKVDAFDALPMVDDIESVALGDFRFWTFVGHDSSAELQGLIAHMVHHFGAGHAIGISRKVFDLGREHQLAAGNHQLAWSTCENEGLEIRSGRIQGRGPTGRPRTDDHHFLRHCCSP